MQYQDSGLKKSALGSAEVSIKFYGVSAGGSHYEELV